MHVDHAIRLDPLAALPSWEREYCLYAGRLYDSVVVQHARTRHLDPNLFYQDSWIGAAYREMGMISQALAEYERAQLLASGRPLYGRAITLHRAGRQDEARRVLAALEAGARRGTSAAWYVAAAYAGIGDRDRAFAWLDQSADARETPGHVYFPEYDAIRADPRLERYLVRTGLLPSSP